MEVSVGLVILMVGVEKLEFVILCDTVEVFCVCVLRYCICNLDNTQLQFPETPQNCAR